MILRTIRRRDVKTTPIHDTINVRVNDEMFKLFPHSEIVWEGARDRIIISHTCLLAGPNGEVVVHDYKLGADFESIVTGANGTYVINWSRKTRRLEVDTI